jgi:ribonuclease P protein component
MLSHKYRFHGHGSLRYLYRNGLTARNRAVLVKYCENKHRPHSRVAVVVGKKVAKSAVKRNRIRRRIFEVIRKHWEYIKPHYDISLTVFTAEFMTMSPEEVEENIVSVLKQAHLYSKTQITPVAHESDLEIGDH